MAGPWGTEGGWRVVGALILVGRSVGVASVCHVLSLFTSGPVFSVPFPLCGLVFRRLDLKLSRAGHLWSRQPWSLPAQFMHGSLQSRVPATACWPWHRRSWDSVGCVPSHLVHLESPLGTEQLCDVETWPSLWHREHCTRGGLSSHFSIRACFPKSPCGSLRSLEVMVPSRSEYAKDMDEYVELILSTGLIQRGGSAKWVWPRPVSDLTSFRSTSGLKTLPMLSVTGTPCAITLVHPREGQSWDGPGNGAMRYFSYAWMSAKGISPAIV